jgi:fumarate hydratase class I
MTGIFLEKLETDVGKYLPEVMPKDVSNNVVALNINMPMSQLRQELSKLPVTTRLSLTGRQWE